MQSKGRSAVLRIITLTPEAVKKCYLIMFGEGAVEYQLILVSRLGLVVSAQKFIYFHEGKLPVVLLHDSEIPVDMI
jgi:hypothetical protein